MKICLINLWILGSVCKSISTPPALGETSGLPWTCGSLGIWVWGSFGYSGWVLIGGCSGLIPCPCWFWCCWPPNGLTKPTFAKPLVNWLKRLAGLKALNGLNGCCCDPLCGCVFNVPIPPCCCWPGNKNWPEFCPKPGKPKLPKPKPGCCCCWAVVKAIAKI